MANIFETYMPGIMLNTVHDLSRLILLTTLNLQLPVRSKAKYSEIVRRLNK